MKIKAGNRWRTGVIKAAGFLCLLAGIGLGNSMESQAASSQPTVSLSHCQAAGGTDKLLLCGKDPGSLCDCI